MQSFKNSDFWTGVLFVIAGTAGAVSAMENEVGTLSRMGPAFFPIAVSVLLAGTGMLLVAKGLISGRKNRGSSIRLHAILPIAGSVCVFSVALVPLGLIPSLILLVCLSSLAGGDFRPAETLLLSFVLSGLSWLVFVYGLGMHISAFTSLF